MKYKMMILATLTALGLTACQSSTEADTQTPNSGTVIMQNGTTYTVKKGDKLIKTTDDAVVKITKKTESETSEVVLVSGEAKIIFN